MSLDPDDPRPPYQQVAAGLRAAIKTRKLEPGDKLPSQNELAERYGVARMTIHQALKVLRDEGLVVTRQGSGAYVRAPVERPFGLRPHVEAAFGRPNVSIDFAGLSGETLHNTLAEVLDKVRAGRFTPESINIRVLVVDTTKPLVLPSLAETKSDDPRVRKRSDRITRRSIDSLVHEVNELGELGLVPSVSIEVRVHQIAPSFKLFVLNNEEAFFGFYLVQSHKVRIDDDDVDIFDVLGRDASLFHYTVRDGDVTNNRQFIETAQRWFDSVWMTISTEYTP